MPGHRTPIKRERGSPPADDDNDDDRHRHRNRSRSPCRDKVDKGKGRLKRKKEEEKLIVVRKRIKDDDNEREPKPTAPDWLVQIAHTIIGRENRNKYKYSLEKRGGSGSGSGSGRDGDEGGYPEKKHPKVYDGQGNAHFLVPDGNGTYRMEVDDSTGPARTRKAEAKAEELMKVPHDILDEMHREDKKRERLLMSYEKYPGFNHGAETVSERYMRTTGQSENP